MLNWSITNPQNCHSWELRKKGAKCPFRGASSYDAHMNQATKAPFPLSAPCPLPEEITKAIKFLLNADTDLIRSFWKEQIAHLIDLSAHPYCSSASWYTIRPKFLAEAPSALNVALLAQLCSFYQIGALEWLSQYIYGFPINAAVCQSLAFPMSGSPDNPYPVSKDSLMKDAPCRLKARSGRRPPHASVLWEEAMTQVQLGWLATPRLLSSSGRFADAPNFPINNAFRIAVVQNEKIRACDDLLASGTNSSCSVLSPITIPSWEHVAQISSELSHRGLDLAFGKGDESDAYKKQPIFPAGAFSAVITPQGGDGRRYGFVPRSQLFGPVVSVLHYNTFSRLLVSLFVKIFGIPAVAYFDDYGFVILRTSCATPLILL